MFDFDLYYQTHTFGPFQLDGNGINNYVSISHWLCIYWTLFHALVLIAFFQNSSNKAKVMFEYEILKISSLVLKKFQNFSCNKLISFQFEFTHCSLGGGLYILGLTSLALAFSSSPFKISTKKHEPSFLGCLHSSRPWC